VSREANKRERERAVTIQSCTGGKATTAAGTAITAAETLQAAVLHATAVKGCDWNLISRRCPIVSTCNRRPLPSFLSFRSAALRRQKHRSRTTTPNSTRIVNTLYSYPIVQHILLLVLLFFLFSSLLFSLSLAGSWRLEVSIGILRSGEIGPAGSSIATCRTIQTIPRAPRTLQSLHQVR
jgi:hypothetical protein